MKVNDRSTLKVFKSGDYSYIYIYFKFKGKTLRINTRNKYVKSYMTTDLYYNSGMNNFKMLNLTTKYLKERVDKYIELKLKTYDPQVDQKECVDFIHRRINIDNLSNEKVDNKN